MGCDVLCAVCAGPLFQVHIADQSKSARGSDDSDDDSQYGYDPEIVSPKDVEWAQRCLILGFNSRSTAIDKMYLTGPASYEDYGCFGVQSSSDPNFPEDSPNFQCYVVCDATQTSCYPIHAPCLRLLTKVLSGTEASENIDKDIIYHTFANLEGHYMLDLDYGKPDNEFDQYWAPNSGAEMLVVSPMPTSTFTDFLRKTVSTADFTLSPPTVINSQIRNDPLAALPYDVAHAILLLLPGHTVLTLCTASYPLHAFFGPSNRSFWRVALCMCMPWFWELHELMRDDSLLDPQTVDYKGLFLWADKETTPREGLRGPFMGIANRRRIWGVCDQIEADYTPRAAVKARERVRTATAELIWEKSVNLDVPSVLWPKLEKKVRTRTTTAQWIRDETSHLLGGVFEAFWDERGSLVGIAFAVDDGSEKTIFGKTYGVSTETDRVESGIAGLVLHLPDIFVHDKMETSIKGITVLSSGKSYNLGDTNPQYCQRVLSVSSDYGLTGIAGHITDDGRITRLGLIQHPLVDDNDDQEMAPALLHRFLWKAPTTSTSNAFHNATSPIWSHHPRLRALPSTTRILDPYQVQCRYHEDIVPTDVLIWAANAHELQSVRRISAYHHLRRHISALRVDFAPESGILPRVVGEEAGRRLVEGFPSTWDISATDNSWVPFEIDGAGGEVVVAVDVVHDEDIKTVVLRTNRDRQVVWGEELREYRKIEAMEPQDGETVIGLAVGFIYPFYSSFAAMSGSWAALDESREWLPIDAADYTQSLGRRAL
ncbi:hypothetical protein C8R45DRAFT_1222734 [Mycena sanguinolenta]|nr:hypothetical protein C8R45DRAFT_1222734 [Mycena sanguinolenta]